jgi:hypothetical protein
MNKNKRASYTSAYKQILCSPIFTKKLYRPIYTNISPINFALPGGVGRSSASRRTNVAGSGEGRVVVQCVILHTVLVLSPDTVGRSIYLAVAGANANDI